MPERSGSPTLGDAGEGAALERILARLPHGRHTVVGPGDDAAVLRAPDGRFVVSTDTMVHGPDFRLAWSTFYDLGWKATVTNLSDIAAMGAAPTGLVIALAVPASTTLDELEHFADGVREACDEHAHGVVLVGGDLTVSDTLTVAVTVFGDLGGAAPVLRSGASPGEVLAVTGDLGLAGAGIALLFAEATELVEGVRTPSSARAASLWSRHRRVLEAQLRPRSPIAAGAQAAASGATAMMDVSDGLVLDATRLARASGVTLNLDHGAIEAEADALRRAEPSVGDAARDCVLFGGEDHALLAAFPPSRVPTGWRVIGSVLAATDHGYVLLGGEALPSRDATGWDPYRAWDGVTG